MYVKKIKIINYGPIDSIHIDLPFSGEFPRPLVLVGENGSGKSIFLSHIVNQLISMQQSIYSGTPEVEEGKLYKFIHPSYIKSGKQYSFGRVDFQNDLYCEELCLSHSKKHFVQNNEGHLPDDDTNETWKKMHDDDNAVLNRNFSSLERKEVLRDAWSKNCVLYFPPNRFEEPAWLNQENLRYKARYMNIKHVEEHTSRKIISYSPLYDNQNWLFEVVYDLCVFTKGPAYVANSIYEIALSVVRQIFRSDQNLRFGIGERRNRRISLMLDEESVVPNIFQFSSGETCLLNLFLSILRDFDLSDGHTLFTEASNVRGIVIVDEIDLHLHVIHQHEVLPKLIKMFPQIQFIVTTHSPLFVLGMENIFGPSGFALYNLPQGQQISSEEFSEFGKAYELFAETRKFSNQIRQEIENAKKTVVFMEGETDIKYLIKSSKLLNRENILENKIELKPGDGYGNLDNIWKSFHPELAGELLPQKVILLYDCDKTRCDKKGNMFRRNIPKKDNHPLKRGIENLFDRQILEKALQSNPTFIDINEEHEKTERGEKTTVPERWEVNENEKTNLCNWLCENGEEKDFEHFKDVFDLLEELLRS